jgi:tRNA (cmo5U34)-methyltransferase
MAHRHDPFANAGVIETYISETPRKVPGLADLHRMTMLLLSEGARKDARILVVGAGGGMELMALAEAQPEWSFVGVDPSGPMLELARSNVQAIAERVELVEGTIEVAPADEFDGATCLLVLHFLDRRERLHTLMQIHQRLRPGTRLVVAHHSAGTGDAALWLTRSAAFADRATLSWEKASATGATMAGGLPLLPESEEEALMRDAGFADVELFYSAFSFKGWVATA